MKAREMTRKETRTLQYKMSNLLSYNPESGDFTWKTSRPGVKSGSIAGCIDKKSGYRSICIDGIKYRASRLAFLSMLGRWPIPTVDHGDRNRGNNAWSNLSEANNTIQQRNQGIQVNNSSHFTGVSLDRGADKWRASIKKDKKPMFLGLFENKLDACLARANAERELGGYPGDLDDRIEILVSTKELPIERLAPFKGPFTLVKRGEVSA